MSKVKPVAQADSAASSKTPESSHNQKKMNHVKKTFFKHTNKKNTSLNEQDKTKVWLPPKDPQQFSSNWKTFLEVLKSNPDPVNKPPVQENSKKLTQTHTPDISRKSHKLAKDITKEEVVAHKKPAKDLSKTVTDEKAVKTKQDNRGKAGKESTDPCKVQVNVKGPESNGTQQRNAKRKQSNVQMDSKAHTTKKKKVEVEIKETTESDMWFDDVDPDDIEATVGTHAADIMRKIQGVKKSDTQTTEKALVRDNAFEGLTKAVAMDCEMVGVGPGGEESILARVSIVNQFGKCIYDKYVKPTENVTDYRTAVSGIRPNDIKNGENLKTVQKEVAEILQGRTLVGHAIHNDLKILFLDHPKKRIRDTQKYKPFRKTVKTNRPSLKHLCKAILNVEVQKGEHSSVQDAQATMRLYTMAKKQWEAEIKASHNNPVLTKTRKPLRPGTPRLPRASLK
ncbi:hypothetical protein UPYG_G00278750 [Umbra pygmaea]|uniref:RNA exonuclease 4 n=1 Tax=Umbra pygmaea TaxID=75934 RepID=A0ABD0WRK1_UMBPY